MKIICFILSLLSFQNAFAQPGVPSGSQPLDISKLAPGTYYYTITGSGTGERTGRVGGG